MQTRPSIASQAYNMAAKSKDHQPQMVRQKKENAPNGASHEFD
ncbi:MAG: hypothetical protein ACK521_04460 [bacterium]|jgi:hypothetical protein